jgi:hypothetical protein
MGDIKQSTSVEGNQENINIAGGGSVKKILILAANPKTTTRLRLDEEIREIKEGLRRAQYRSQFEIDGILAVRQRDFRRALLDYKPQIVHFSGHGNREGVLVEDEVGLGKLFSSKALTELFKLCANDVECVILSACYSAAHANAINRHINYVIGMKKEIEDKSAVEFAVGFYDALGAGKSVEEAFQFGRAAIMAVSPDLPNHLVPILKKRKSYNNNELNNQEQAEKSNEGYNNRPAKKDSSDNKSKGPTIIANTIGNVQTVDGDVTYNYDVENYYE